MSRSLAPTETRASNVTTVDFRRPSRINRDAVVALETTHETFARRLGTAWSSSTHTAIEIEHLATEQLSVDDYIRTLPSPTMLATLRIGAIGATALMDVDLPLSLLLVERLLGGSGEPAATAAPRRPTDLETTLIAQELLVPAVAAIDEALRDLDDGAGPSELIGVETTPQPMQLAAPGELLLLLTYRVELRGDLCGQGLLNLGYPVAPLLGELDRLVAGPHAEDDDPLAQRTVAGAVLHAPLDLHVRLGGSDLRASDLAGLQPGDVLRLDHPVGQPARLVCDGRDVGAAYLGRRGRRLAAQIVTPPAGLARPDQPAVAG